MAKNIDLNKVAVIKIHPAIGVARVSRNSDYFEFFDFHQKPMEERRYMSKGQVGDPHYDKLSIKRQAVKFQAIAYDADGNILGNLSDDARINTDWEANLGNRKLHFRSIKRNREEPSKPILPEIKAVGSTKGVDEIELTGNDPWGLGKKVTLGTLKNNGLFIPPKVTVIGKTDEEDQWNFDDYTGYEFLELTDTTSDGTISVTISGPEGVENIPVLHAWLVVATHRHAFGVTPRQMEDTKIVKPGGIIGYNYDFTRETKENILYFEGEIHDPSGMDKAMFDELNGEYRPGIELCLDDDWMEDEIHDVKPLFYPPGEGHLKPNEIRLRAKGNENEGARPGQLTSGLCSQWQGDMATCLDYWTAENPERATDTDGTSVYLIHADDNKQKRLAGFKNVYEKMDLRPVAEGKYDPEQASVTFTIKESNELGNDTSC